MEKVNRRIAIGSIDSRAVVNEKPNIFRNNAPKDHPPSVAVAQPL